MHRAKIAHQRVRMEGWRQRRPGSKTRNSQGGRRKNDLTHTGLLMGGLGRLVPSRGPCFTPSVVIGKQTTTAFVSWRVADSLGVEPVRYTVSRKLMAIRSLLSCYAL